MMCWTDAYEQIIEVVEECFPDEEAIEARVEELYLEHKGDPIWEEAWRRWNE